MQTCLGENTAHQSILLHHTCQAVPCGCSSHAQRVRGSRHRREPYPFHTQTPYRSIATPGVQRTSWPITKSMASTRPERHCKASVSAPAPRLGPCRPPRWPPKACHRAAACAWPTAPPPAQHVTAPSPPSLTAPGDAINSDSTQGRPAAARPRPSRPADARHQPPGRVSRRSRWPATAHMQDNAGAERTGGPALHGADA